jgi:hypothetical protein
LSAVEALALLVTVQVVVVVAQFNEVGLLLLHL